MRNDSGLFSACVVEKLAFQILKTGGYLRPAVLEKIVPRATSPGISGALSLAARIHVLEHELADLRQQQRQVLITAIATTIGSAVAFSAADVWRHREVDRALAAALEEAGIENPRRLGRVLRQCGFVRIGRDESGCIWTLSS